MAFNSRDLWVVLKAQDQATRALNSFSRSVRDAGAAARLAQLEAQRAQAQSSITARTHTEALQRNEIAQLANQKAAIQNAMAQARLTGTTQQQLQAMQASKNAIDNEIVSRRGQLLAHQQATIGYRQQAAAIDDEINKIHQASAATEEHENKLRRLHGTLQSVSQMAYTAGFVLSASAVGGAVAMGKLIQASAEYERQARLTATQTEGFGTNLNAVAEIGKRVANTIGVGFKEIQPALYDIFSSMDVSVADSEKLLTGFAKAAVAGQTDIQSVSRGTIGILNSFNLTAADTNRVLDLQFEFIRKGVGTYDEWAKRIGLVSPSASRAGQSLETMMAALASASRMSGVASRAGTAVARSFDAISNSKAADALKKIGISVADAKGNFRPFIDIMFDIRKHLDKIPGEAKKAAVIQDIFKGAGGTIEARRFLNNLLLVGGNLEDLQAIYKDTQNAGGSLDKAYGVMAESVATKTELLKNKFQLFKIALGDALAPAVSKLLDWGNKLLDWFNQLDPKTQKVAANVLLIASAFAAVGGPLAFIIGGIAALVGALVLAGPAILGTIGALAGFGIVFLEIGAAFYALYRNSEQFRAIIKDVGDFLRRMAAIAKQAWQDVVDVYNTHLKPALMDLWFTIDTKIMPKIRDFAKTFEDKVIPAAKEVERWFKERLKTAFDMVSSAIKDVLIPALEKIAEFYAQHKKEIDEFIDKIVWFGKQASKAAAAFAELGGGAAIGLVISALGILLFIILGVANAIIWINQKGDEFKQKLIDWSQAITNFKDKLIFDISVGLVTLVNKINEFINTVIGRLLFLFNWLISTAAGYLQTLKTIWATVWDEIKQWVLNALNNIVSGISGKLGEAQNIASNAWNNIKNAASSAWNDVVNTIANALSNAVSTIRGRVSDALGSFGNIRGILGIASAAFGGLPGAIAGGIGSMIGMVAGIPGRIQGALGNLGGLLFGAGQSVVSGFINGISSMIGSAASTAANMAAAALSAAKGALGIGSPSKEFAKVGKYSIDGVIVGLKAGQYMLEQNVGKVFSGLTDQVANQAAFNQNAGNGSGSSFLTPPPVGQQGSQRPVIVNVYTQEIDPRRNAEELGRQLAGVV